MKNSQTLRTFFSPIEAEILKTRLDAAGIPAVVNGSEVATTLSHMGVATARVKVDVLPEHFERACEILREDERLRSELTTWNCRRCDEFNEATFEMCWSCDKPRDDQDALGSIPPPKPKPQVADAQTHESVAVDLLDSRQAFDGNPYQPPPLADAQASHDQQTTPAKEVAPAPECDDETIALVRRIFIGAVLSPLVLPPLVTLYVTYLMFQVPLFAYRNPKLRLRLVIAWILLALSWVIALAVFPFPALLVS